MSEPQPVDLSPDPAVQMLGGYLRVALTVAARVAEQAVFRRAEMLRAAESWGREHAEVVRRQLSGEAAAVRAELAPVVHPEWWERASVEQMAHAWASARSYAPVDPVLAGSARWIGEEIERRHGMDPEALWRQVETEAAAKRGRVVSSELLAEADAADLHRFTEGMASELGGYPMRSPTLEESRAAARESVAARDAWDSPARREALAGRLAAAGVPREAAEARLLADRGRGAPPSAARVPAPTALDSRRARRGRDRERGRER